MRTHRKEFMNEKDIKTKSDKEDSEDFQFNIDYHKEDDEDFDEDIPFSENWKRVSLDKMKKDFNNWLDDSIEQEFVKDPEFYLSDDVNEKRFYMRIINRGPFEEEDEDLEFKEYTCIFVPYDTKRVEMT